MCIQRSNAAGRIIDFHGASSLVNHKSKLTPIRVNYTPVRRAGTDEQASERARRWRERGGRRQPSVSSIPRTRLNGVANRRHWKVSRGVIYPTSCRRLPTGRGTPRLPANIPVQRVQVIPSMNGQVTQQSLCSLCVNATC